MSECSSDQISGDTHPVLGINVSVHNGISVKFEKKKVTTTLNLSSVRVGMKSHSC